MRKRYKIHRIGASKSSGTKHYTRRGNGPEQPRFGNIPRSFSEYKTIALFRLLQLVTIIFVIIILIISYPLLNRLYTSYKQIDHWRLQFLILLSTISLLSSAFFLFGILKTAEKPKSLILIFSGCTGVFFLSSILALITWKTAPYSRSLAEADIIIANFERMVELPFTLTIEGLSVPEPALKTSDYISSHLMRWLVQFHLVGDSPNQNYFRIVKTNKSIKDYRSAIRLLKKTKAIAVIWGFDVISVGQNMYQIYPIFTFRKNYLPGVFMSENVSERINLQNALTQVVTLIEDISELKTWTLLIALNTYFYYLERYSEENANSVSYDIMDKDKIKWIEQLLKAYRSDLKRKIANTQKESQKFHYNDLFTYLNIISRSFAKLHDLEPVPIDTRYTTKYNYDVYWDNAYEAFEIATTVSTSTKANWVSVIEKFKECLKIRERDFNAFFFIGLCYFYKDDWRMALTFYIKALEQAKTDEIQSSAIRSLDENIQVCLSKDFEGKGSLQESYQQLIKELENSIEGFKKYRTE